MFTEWGHGNSVVDRVTFCQYQVSRISMRTERTVNEKNNLLACKPAWILKQKTKHKHMNGCDLYLFFELKLTGKSNLFGLNNLLEK